MIKLKINLLAKNYMAKPMCSLILLLILLHKFASAIQVFQTAFVFQKSILCLRVWVFHFWCSISHHFLSLFFTRIRICMLLGFIYFCDVYIFYMLFFVFLSLNVYILIEIFSSFTSEITDCVTRSSFVLSFNKQNV